MDSQKKVYRGRAYSSGSDMGEVRHYVEEATVTGIVVDGRSMVRMYDLLLPADGWVTSKVEAKQQIVDQIVRAVGQMTAVIDTLRDEVLHETLMTEAA